MHSLSNLTRYYRPPALAIAFASIVLVFSGCGTTKSYTATEQLLLSDAVDATVAKLDFSPLAGRKVYLDSTYLNTQRSPLLVDSDYVISSLRQQMVGSEVFLVDSREEADIIAEARLGALGLDGHSVTYGVPASNTLNAASSVITSGANLPILPEMSLARRENKQGAAKIAVFAYERETKEPFWQSGIAASSSKAKDTWVLGIGPFQQGTIHNRTKFAGGDIKSVDLLDQSPVDIRKSEAFSQYRRTRMYSGANEAAAAKLASNLDKDGASSNAEASGTQESGLDDSPVDSGSGETIQR